MRQSAQLCHRTGALTRWGRASLFCSLIFRLDIIPPSMIARPVRCLAPEFGQLDVRHHVVALMASAAAAAADVLGAVQVGPELDEAVRSVSSLQPQQQQQQKHGFVFSLFFVGGLERGR